MVTFSGMRGPFIIESPGSGRSKGQAVRKEAWQVSPTVTWESESSTDLHPENQGLCPCRADESLLGDRTGIWGARLRRHSALGSAVSATGQGPTFPSARRSRGGAVGRYEARVLPRLASSGFCRYVSGLGACCHRGAARSLFLDSDRLGRRVSKHRRARLAGTSSSSGPRSWPPQDPEVMATSGSA